MSESIGEHEGILTFDEWLKDELSREVNKHFNPDGNSSRAVALRGAWGQFKWISKRLIPNIISEIKYGFDGWDTGIGYILAIIILPFVIWLMPFTRTYATYKRAIRDYKRSYGEYCQIETKKLIDSGGENE